jgi:small-conductance mechanosensitive channel
MPLNIVNFAWKTLFLLGIVLLSLLIGFFLQRFISSKLRKVAQKTIKRWDDVLAKSLRGFAILWFFLACLAIALKTITLPHHTLRLLNRLITLAAIFSGIFVSERFSVRSINLYVDKITGIPTTIFKNVAAIILYILGFMIILDYLGISITPIVTALGIGGLAIALALQDTLYNLFSGIHILITKKIRPGDYIRLESGEEGYVTDITWRNTTIRALANNLILIPNTKLAASIVTFFYLPEKEMAVLVDVGISYDSDFKKVEKVTQEVG